MKITNNTGIPLGLAVWVMHDDYDYINEPNYISVTSLMKPVRQIILPKRIPVEQQEADISDFVASALGKSIHASIEKAWIEGYKVNLKKLGYPQSVIDCVQINPEKVTEGAIPVFLEQRAKKEIDGYTIGGKFDLVIEGILHDNKSTSVYSWIYNDKDDEYALQGSLYRWLNQDKITEDFIRINFVFTDWAKAEAKRNPNYPQSRLLSRDIKLWSVEKTEEWVRNKLASLTKYMSVAEKDLPECTDKELWLSETIYKYYKDPSKTDGRSTKNFTDAAEARSFLASQGGIGILKTFAGKPRRCEYCPAYSICTQKDKYDV